MGPGAYGTRQVVRVPTHTAQPPRDTPPILRYPFTHRGAKTPFGQ